MTVGLFLIGLILFTKNCFSTSSPVGASLVAQMVKNLPAMQETLVRSLGWEDPLEKEMATHSSILAWRIPWTEEDRKSTRLNSSHVRKSRMPSSA